MADLPDVFYYHLLQLLLRHVAAGVPADSGFDLRSAGWLGVLALLGMGIGNVLGGWVSDVGSKRWGRRLGRRLPGMLGPPLAAGGFLAAMWTTHRFASAAVFAAAAGLISMAIPPAWAVCLDIGGRHAGVMGGMMTNCGCLGGAFSTVLCRDDGWEVWRGDSCGHMSERTPMRSPFVEPDCLHVRLKITAAMEAHGFRHYPFEFWHYSKGDAMQHLLSGNPQPAPYGPVDWDSRTNEVVPVRDPAVPLNPIAVIEREITAALCRIADADRSHDH